MTCDEAKDYGLVDEVVTFRPAKKTEAKGEKNKGDKPKE